MRVFQLQPQDVLFFGGGQAPRTPWPLPCVWFDALHAALHRAFPQIQMWERLHAYGVSGVYPNRRERPQRFGSLLTVGPFPAQTGAEGTRWWFPAPVDAPPADGSPAECPPLAIAASGRADVVGAFAVAPAHTPGRGPSMAWWSKAGVEAWLRDQRPSAAESAQEGDLFGIEPVFENRLPDSPCLPVVRRVTAYLRCRDEIGLGCAAESRGWGGDDGWVAKWVGSMRYLRVGGRQRWCRWGAGAELPLAALLPVSVPVTGVRVRFLLLSPAYFPPIASAAAHPGVTAHPGGWLPNWVCPTTGQVLLRKGASARRTADRAEWRQQTRSLPPLDCRLVAASVPPLFPYRGWSERRHLRGHLPDAQPGPKPECRLAPAGSVYYFEGPDAPELARLLAWHGDGEQVAHRRSARWGEKGFGIGVCGPWTSLASPTPSVPTLASSALAPSSFT